MKNTYSLNSSDWLLYYYDTVRPKRINCCDLEGAAVPKIPARVPGNVELDLGRASLLPNDIFKGMSVKCAEKFETYEYIYKKEFTAGAVAENEKAYLRFDGVDCLAEYELNGTPIGKSSNAFMPHEFDVTNVLNQNDKNILFVRIKSSLCYTLSQSYNQYLLHGSHITGGCHIRKPAHSYGWDIFPRLLTAGIWKDVSLIIKPDVHFDEIVYHTRGGGGETDIEFTVSVTAPAEYFLDNKLRMTASGSCKNSEFFADHCFWRKNAVRFTVKPDDIKLWWPYGYGEPDLYATEFTLYYGEEILDTVKMNVGVRTAKLLRSESLSDENHVFQFEINGTKVIAKGSNWVPLDALHSRDKERYESALALVKESGCNILRVWGGGVYEQKCFYDFCDKNGIMLWQDFMMACQNVPTDEEMLKNITDEFTWAIKELRSHASLVLWSGDNENDQMFNGHAINPDKNFITRELIPGLLFLHDPYREYLPSSPYINSKNFELLQKGINLLPEEHLWGPRDYYKSGFYRDSKALFVSETGYHGCPKPESIKRMFDEGAVWDYDNEQWTLHSSDYMGDNSRITMMVNHLLQLFGEIPDNLEDFSLASQISQAEALKFFIERMRTALPRRGGIIWWNILDGWPQVSDAVTDYYFNKKLAFDYIKVSQQPFCIMVGELSSWHYPVYAANDTLSPKSGTLTVSDLESGEELYKGEFSVKENETVLLARIRLFYSDKRILLLHWVVDGKDFYNHYLCGMPPFSFEKYKSLLGRIEEKIK